MDSYLALTIVKLLLEKEGRISYRILERELGIAGPLLEELKHELVEFSGLARDENGKGLVWVAGPPSEVTETAHPGMRSPRPASPVADGSDRAGAVASTELSAVPTTPTQSDAERRQLTVMFCDLVGSTALSTRLDPEDLRDVITRFQDTCRTAIERYDGFIARYMGDGMLVYFGYPQAHENDAERAVRAGLDIVGAMAGLDADTGNAHGVSVAVRVGVATGPVVVGDIVGEGAAEEAAVVGETPNLAARLQAAAAENQLVVSPTVRRLVGDLFELESLGTRELRGIAEPIEVWRVVRERDADAPAEAGRGTARHALIGRQEEVGLLLRAWEASREGRGQAVLIQGEAGIGKSRLIEALRERVTGTDYLWVAVRCSPYHVNSTLYPVIEHLRRAVGWAADDSPETRLAKLEDALRGQSQPLDEVVPLFAELLLLPLPPDRYPPTSLNPQQKREATLDAIVGWLLDEAERHPVLQVWEDLHWADATTLELLGLYIEQSPVVAMLNVLTFRPEFSPPWATRSHMTPITLNRMERPEVEALVGLHAGGKALPEAVVDHIADKADGVPLYVEELTKAILESKFLREEADRFVLEGPLADLAIPTTLQDSLMARLDRVPRVRELAQLGAVLGREFAYEMLRSLTALEEPVLQEGLVQLVANELLYQRGRPPRARYIFKHALIHDAAYQSLLRRTRQQYHRSVARLLEERFHETVEAHPELLAHHYTEAGEAEQALTYWQAAGERSRAQSAHWEAIGHLSRGLEVLGELPEGKERGRRELALQLSLGHASLVAKGHAAGEVETAYRRARDLCQELGDVPEIVPAVFGLWRFYVVCRPLDGALALAAQLLELAEEADDPVRTVIAHYTTGFTNLAMGHLGEARRHLVRAIAEYDPSQRSADVYRAAHDPRTACLIYSALDEWLLGYPDRAQERRRESVRQAEALDDVSLAHALSFGSIVSEMRGDDVADDDTIERIIRVSSERGFAAWHAFGNVMRSWYGSHESEDPSQLQRSLQAFESIDFEIMVPYFMTLIARACIRMGRFGEALAALDRAQAIVDGHDERWWEPEVHRMRGELLLAGSPAAGGDAEACFERAAEIARGQGARSLELRAAMSLGRLWHDRGEPARATEVLGSVYGEFSEGFDTGDVREARRMLEGWGVTARARVAAGSDAGDD